MSATLQQDCYAALWSALFIATHSLDRYAGQGELFNRDQGDPDPAPAPKPDHFPDTPRKPAHEYRQSEEIFPGGRDAHDREALVRQAMSRPNVVDAKIEPHEKGVRLRILHGQTNDPSPQPRHTPRPSFTTREPLATEPGTAGLDLGDRPGPMFPGIERTPEHHWIQQSTVVPDKPSAQGMLAQQRQQVGFHHGEVVPAGQMWRVNRLYRFNRVQYPTPAQETQ